MSFRLLSRGARFRVSVHVDHGLSKGVWSFLRQIVPYPALEKARRIPARELLPVRTGFRMRRTVGIAFEGNGGHGDDRTPCQSLFELVVPRLALGEAETPSIVMNYDLDMIRVVE